MMKITATKDNLLYGVSTVQKAVSSKNTLPILTCIKVEAQNNNLTFFATDLEMGIQCQVPVDVVYEGIAIIPARHFSELVRRLPDTLITLEMAGENELLIHYDDSQLTLKTLPPADFPKLPQIKGEHEIQIQSSLFRQMIRQTAFAAGTDEGRPLFTGILCEIDEGKMRMIGTDTHRLALRQGLPQKQPEKSVSFIIPAKMLTEIARLINDEEEPCYLNVARNLCTFTVTNIHIICRLLDGQFPNYRQVIPTQYKSKGIVKSKTLQEAVERIALFTTGSDAGNTIHLKVQENKITISSQSELGQGYEQVAVDLEGEPVNISFNARYLLDVFKIIDSEMASIEFTGSLSPCIIRPTENDNLLYLLLPVRS